MPKEDQDMKMTSNKMDQRPDEIRKNETKAKGDAKNDINNSPAMQHEQEKARASETGNYFLLVKNLPTNFSEKDILSVFIDVKSITEVFTKPNSNNVYLKMTDLEELESIVNQNNIDPITIDSVKLKMCLVSKLPLDLNKKSRILLITLYNEKIPINVDAMYRCFHEYAMMKKIIIFKKKNYQVLIEFWSAEDAMAFQQTFDSRNFEGLFFMKIQFTQKSQLIVQSNSIYEHDFSKIKKFQDQREELKPFSGEKNFKDVQSPPQEKKQQVNTFGDVLAKEKIQAKRKPSDSSSDEIFYSLKIGHLDPEIKHKHLFNLFSLYGNIERIMINPETQTAQIYYTTEFEQITAFHHLNELRLFNCVLNLELENGPISKSKNETELTVFYKKSDQVTAEMYQSKQKTINKPFHILYIFNLTKSVGLDVIEELFGHVEPVLNVYYLNDSKNSALCHFSSVSAAVKVLCNFKNINLVDKSLKINFANENLIKDNQKDKKVPGKHQQRPDPRGFDYQPQQFGQWSNSYLKNVPSREELKRNDFQGRDFQRPQDKFFPSQYDSRN